MSMMHETLGASENRVAETAPEGHLLAPTPEEMQAGSEQAAQEWLKRQPVMPRQARAGVAPTLEEMQAGSEQAAREWLKRQPVMPRQERAHPQLRPMQLTDFLFSGPAAYARQWVLVNRQMVYDPSCPSKHSLILNYGASSYPGGIIGVEVDEGEIQADLSGRKWHVEIHAWQPRPKGGRAVSPPNEKLTTEDKRELVIEAIDRLAVADGAEVKRKSIQEETGLSGTVLTAVLRQLESDQVSLVRKEQVTNGKKSYQIHHVRLAPNRPRATLS
jgi:hypothetical protein